MAAVLRTKNDHFLYEKGVKMVSAVTQYTKNGDIHLAYQVIGDGPVDLVMVPGFISQIECYWEEPSFARALTWLASFSRLIIFDKRGTGLSDRVSDMPTIEQRMGDVRAVMDAAGSERAAIFGVSEGGAMSTVFAATYPERTSLLILYGAFAEFSSWYPAQKRLDAFFNYCETKWGTGDSVRSYAPTLAEDRRFKKWWARFERQGASPGAAIALMRMNAEIDVKHVLSAIQAPTLVIHRKEDIIINVKAGRYLAERIPEAKYVELPGKDHLFWAGDTKRTIEQIEKFVTGTQAKTNTNSVLATVLFTDIVGSTQLAADLGDQRWRDLLDAYYATIRSELNRFGGNEIDTIGDGLLATFDGPARAIHCALECNESVRELGLKIRAGLHTGECELLEDKVSGIAVHIGARVVREARPGEVLVSSTVKDLVAGSKIDFKERETVELKGVPGTWKLYAAER